MLPNKFCIPCENEINFYTTKSNIVYFFQHLLERGKSLERSQIIKKLAGQVVQMSQHKFASNVIEKCLKHGSPAERDLLIEEIVGQTEGNDNLLVRWIVIEYLMRNICVLLNVPCSCFMEF